MLNAIRLPVLLMILAAPLGSAPALSDCAANDHRLGDRTLREWASALCAGDRGKSLAAVHDLSSHGVDSIQVLRYLVEEDGEIRFAIRVAQEIGPALLPELKPFAHRPYSPGMRLFAAGSWAGISPHSEEAIEALGDLLSHRTSGWIAADLLGGIHPRGWVRLLQSLDSGNSRSLLNALHGLRKVDPAPPAIQGAIVKLIWNTAPECSNDRWRPAVRTAAVEVVGQLGRRGAPLGPLMAEVLRNDSHAQVRAGAAWSIGQIRVPVESSACLSLVEALDPERTGDAYGTEAGTHDDVLIQALRALGKLGAPHPSAVDRICALLEHLSRRVRLAAAHALLVYDPEHSRARTVCLKDLKTAIRSIPDNLPGDQRQHSAFAIRAIETLQSCRVSSGDAIEAIVKALEVGRGLHRPDLCLYAMRAIRDLLGRAFTSRAPVEDLLLRKDTRAALLISIHTTNRQDPELAAVLASSAVTPSVDLLYALDYLGSLQEVPAVFALPLAVLLSRADTRDRAATALSAMGHRASGAIPQLSDLVSTGWAEERTLSARILGGLLRGGDLDARKPLVEAQHDRRECVREEAELALLSHEN